MATHSSILAWRIPGTEEPSGLPSSGSHRVGHDWSDSSSGSKYLLVNWYLKYLWLSGTYQLGFPYSSVGKEPACDAGDPGLIPGSERSTGKGIGYPLQYFWASLVAQLVKNPPVMRETWVWSLGWEDPPGEGKGYPLQYSGLENSMYCIVHGLTKSLTWQSDVDFTSPVGWCYSSLTLREAQRKACVL